MEKQIVEINGVKFEVDMSTAQVISEYKIGDKINVLVKEYSSKVVYPGIIVGFDNFKELPTIAIAYLKVEYSSASIKFVYFNSETVDIDIAPCRESDILFEKADVLSKMDLEITKKEEEIKDLQRKKNFFVLNFQKHFENSLV